MSYYSWPSSVGTNPPSASPRSARFGAFNMSSSNSGGSLGVAQRATSWQEKLDGEIVLLLYKAYVLPHKASFEPSCNVVIIYRTPLEQIHFVKQDDSESCETILCDGIWVLLTSPSDYDAPQSLAYDHDACFDDEILFKNSWS